MSKIVGHYFLVLDIETSSVEVSGSFMTWLSYGYLNLYDINGRRIESNFFRTWDKLKYLFHTYQSMFCKANICCFVHNLGYEFDFMVKNICRSEKILTNSKHDIISGKLKDFANIDFRCSYQLSGLSLRDLGNLVGLEKLESDYRTYYPEDEIEEEDKKYCCRDCDIVAKYISDVHIKKYNTVGSIPFTKTGVVRERVKYYYNEWVKEYGLPDWDLMPSVEGYKAMKEAFMGGSVFSSIYTTNIVIRNLKCFDIESSYPYVMLSELFPYTIEKVDNFSQDEYLKHKFWIAKISFSFIASKYNWQWIPSSKVQRMSVDSQFFNGKLVMSPNITLTVCSVDFETIKQTYDFDSFEFEEFYACDKYGEIPVPYQKALIEFSDRKYRLKKKKLELEKVVDEDDPEYREVLKEYDLAKADFDCIYGLLVQDIVQKDYYLDEDFIWQNKNNCYVQTKDKHIGRNYLFGVYVTAYARRNVIRGALENCPDTLSYVDTDSLKFFGDFEFKQTNPPLPDKYMKYESLRNLGRFVEEPGYAAFKVLGAKKYAYVGSDGNVRLTVAGLPKQKNKNSFYLNNINDFKPGVTFKGCKLGKKYVVGNIEFDLDDSNEQKTNVTDCSKAIEYCRRKGINTNGGVVLYVMDHTIEVTANDLDLIEQYNKTRDLWLEYLYEKYNQDFRGYFYDEVKKTK